MTEPGRQAHWARFIDSFYSSPNEFSPGRDNQNFQTMVSEACDSWTSGAATPIFLSARVAARSYCYVLNPINDEGTWLRDLIWAYLGSWITFDIDSSSLASLDAAARELVGEEGSVHRFAIAADQDAPKQAYEGIRRLADALKRRPHRRIRLAQPVGRLIGDFLDALASGSQATSRGLFETLSKDRRLSRVNLLFLRLQLLATFERWDEIEKLEQLPDLLRLSRPKLVSDALAQLAMRRLADNASITHFNEIKPEFGALVPSVTAIRSPAGAGYYAYWAISAGEDAVSVAERLDDAGWLDHARHQSELLNTELAPVARLPRVSMGPIDKGALNRALAEGRLDSAIALFVAAEPAPDALPTLTELVLNTLSPDAFEVLRQWREVLGDRAIPTFTTATAQGPEQSIYPSLENAVDAAFSASASIHERAEALEACRELAISGLMRPGCIANFVGHVRDRITPGPQDVGELLNLLLDIERDLYKAAGASLQIQDLRLLILDRWALLDDAGDRHRADRIVILVERLVGAGVSVAVYDEVIEYLRTGWTHLLTDADTPLGIDAIEILAGARPESSNSLGDFAQSILSRIGDHNARRLPSSTLTVAQLLADEFGWGLAITPQAEGSEPAPCETVIPPKGTRVAIYTRMESAGNRAKQVLLSKYPGIRVDVLFNRAGKDDLKFAAKAADVLVIADRAALHAATKSLLDARGELPVDYASGKGSASLLEAASVGLERFLAETRMAATA
jgi:hypothetical protein